MTWLDHPIDRGSAVPARTVLRQICLTLGVAILAIKIPLQFHMVVPANGFEWLNLPELTLAALTLIFGAALLSKTAEPTRECRVEAIAFAFFAFGTAYFAVTRIIGV